MGPNWSTHPATPIRAVLAAVVLAGLACWPQPAAAQSAQRIVQDRSSDPLSLCAQGTVVPQLEARAMRACDTVLATRKIEFRDRVTSTINRGVLHLRRKEAQAALDDFDAAIALDARNAEAHLDRGAALMMLKKPALAVSAITASLSYGVNAPHKAYYNRAAAREALGDIRGAYEDYSAALAIRPDWGLAEGELARFARSRREQLASQLEAESKGGDRTPAKGTP